MPIGALLGTRAQKGGRIWPGFKPRPPRPDYRFAGIFRADGRENSNPRPPGPQFRFALLRGSQNARICRLFSLPPSRALGINVHGYAAISGRFGHSSREVATANQVGLNSWGNSGCRRTRRGSTTPSQRAGSGALPVFVGATSATVRWFGRCHLRRYAVAGADDQRWLDAPSPHHSQDLPPGPAPEPGCAARCGARY